MSIRLAQPSFPRHAVQQGAVLLVALIFLVLLTLLAIGASSGSLLQQRMVAATRSAQLATMSGDTALRGAEWYLWTFSTKHQPIQCNFDSINSSNGCVTYNPIDAPYQPGGSVVQFRTGNNAWLSLAGPMTYKGAGGGTDFTAQPVPTDGASPNVAQNPQYIIENMGLVKPSGAGPQCESGDTGCHQGGPGHINVYIYRITARATGGTDNTVRVVQSTFDAQTN